MFSDLVICYLFLGGSGAGLFTTLCVFEFANARHRYRPEITAPSFYGRGRLHGEARALGRALWMPDEFFEKGWTICILVLGLAISLLICDLGRADKILLLVSSAEPVAITVGAYSLAITFLISLVFVFLTFSSKRYVKFIGAYALASFGVLGGLTAMSYTGLLLAGTVSVLMWRTALIPILFTLSSISCGCAFLFATCSFVDARQDYYRAIRYVLRTDRLLIVCELLALAAYIIWLFVAQGADIVLQVVVTGRFASWLWFGLVLLGLAVPLLLESYVDVENYRTQLLWIAGCLLLGGFLLRYCIVGFSVFDPANLFRMALVY